MRQLRLTRDLSHRTAAAVGPELLAARDPALIEVIVDLFRAIGRYYFRIEVRGIEHVPPTGPALLVGSHNGAACPMDSFLTGVALWDRLGPDRAVHPLADDIVFHDPVLRGYAQRLGFLVAGHQGAALGLRAGHLVLVYPGSDLETYRTWRERYRIDLGGRLGFLRLALRERVPIVPVVSAGTHEQLVVSLPWGLTSGFVPYVPLPAQTTLAFGPPISWPELGPEHAEDKAVLTRCYRQVVDLMQVTLDSITAGRRPFLGQPRGRGKESDPSHDTASNASRQT